MIDIPKPILDLLEQEAEQVRMYKATNDDWYKSEAAKIRRVIDSMYWSTFTIQAVS